MKPAILCASLLLFFTSPAFALDAQELPLEQCLKDGVFDASFSLKGPLEETKISQNQCRLKFVIFQGKGEKFELDLCRPDITINVFSSIDSPTPMPVRAGSYGCPQTALFGADFEQADGDKARFEAEKTKLLGLFTEALGVYGKTTTPESTGGHLVCAKRLLQQYLKDCKAFPAMESLPPGK